MRPPWAKKSRLSPGALTTQRVLLPHAGHCFRRQVLESCPHRSQSDTDAFQGNSLETIRQMVASGLGITVLPLSAVTPKHFNKRLAVVRFTKPVPQGGVALAWSRGSTRSDAIRVIRESVRAVKLIGLTLLDHGSAGSSGALEARHPREQDGQKG